MTAGSPFEHEVIPRLTEFPIPIEQVEMTIQEIYAALVDDAYSQRTDRRRSVERRTEMDAHRCFLPPELNILKYFEAELAWKGENVFVLKGAWGRNSDDR